MNKIRLEAFSDGVIAILITILVLELKIPGAGTWEALQPMLPISLNYALSFIFVGIFWNSHHHILHATTRINVKILWANLHLLFWLPLGPFATARMGENHNVVSDTCSLIFNYSLDALSLSSCALALPISS